MPSDPSTLDSQPYAQPIACGAGQTSLIWQTTDGAQQPVALKVLRPWMGPIAREHFRLESSILTRLTAPAAPRLLEMGEEQGKPFLVLSWAADQSLETCLISQPYLREEVALAILASLLETVAMLHEETGRAHRRLAMPHLFLAAEQVTLLGWNEVGVEGSAPGQNLAELGVILYRLLTGKGAFASGESHRLLALRAGTRWEEISPGTREIVSRALAPHASYRYTSIRAFLDDVRAQYQMDLSDWLVPLSEAKERLAGEVRAPEAIRTRLRWAQHLGARADLVAFYSAQLEALRLTEQTGWQAGAQYYAMGQYRSALSKWHPIAETTGHPAQWRWVALAEAAIHWGSAAFASHQALLEKVVAALEAHQLAVAQAFLADLPTVPESLAREVQARSLIARAQEQGDLPAPIHWANAASLLDEAATLLETLPYGMRLAEAEWGDLRAQAQAWRQRIQVRQEVNLWAATIPALFQDDFAKALLRIERGFQRDPANPRLRQLCLLEGLARMLEGHPVQAVCLLEALCLEGKPEASGQVAQLWDEVRRSLSEPEQAMTQQGEVPNEPNGGAAEPIATAPQPQQKQAETGPGSAPPGI